MKSFASFVQTRAWLLSALLFSGAPALRAQVAPPEKVDPELRKRAENSQGVALKLRSDLATAILAGASSPEAAMTQLRAHSSPSGLRLGADAELAFSAIDVGHRLIAAGRPAEAEVFFREAEKALGAAIGQTSEQASNDKLQYLSARALIRARFLNKPVQAKEDLEAAKRIRPDDRVLQGLESSLGNLHPGLVHSQPKKG